MAQSDIRLDRYRTFTKPGRARPFGRRYILRVFRIGVAPKSKEA